MVLAPVTSDETGAPWTEARAGGRWRRRIGEAAWADELPDALADDAVFERWYRSMLPRVYGYLMARTGGDVHLSEELTQQTFIAAIDRRASFDRRSDSATWLCGIARHKLADHFRKRSRDDRRQMRMEIHEIELHATSETSQLDVGERELIRGRARRHSPRFNVPS